MVKPKTALVLSGGGSLGAVQVGMLQALSQAGLTINMVVGASVGALNGAFFADNPTAAGVERLINVWRTLERTDVFPVTIWSGLKALLLRRNYLIDASGLRALIRRVLRARRIEDARTRLHIVATDALSGQAVRLSKGSIEDALVASAAVPVVFPHVEIGGRYLLDGGVADNTPIASAVALGAQRILVLPTGTSCAVREPPRDGVALALHVAALQNMRQLDRDVARFSSQAHITVVPPLCPLAVSVFDFSHTVALIERAASQTRGWLAAGGLRQSGLLDVPLARHDRPSRSGPICFSASASPVAPTHHRGRDRRAASGAAVDRPPATCRRHDLEVGGQEPSRPGHPPARPALHGASLAAGPDRNRGGRRRCT